MVFQFGGGIAKRSRPAARVRVSALQRFIEHHCLVSSVAIERIHLVQSKSSWGIRQASTTKKCFFFQWYLHHGVCRRSFGPASVPETCSKVRQRRRPALLLHGPLVRILHRRFQQGQHLQVHQPQLWSQRRNPEGEKWKVIDTFVEKQIYWKNKLVHFYIPSTNPTPPITPEPFWTIIELIW